MRGARLKKPAKKKVMGNQPETDDIESFWEGLRPPRDPSTFSNAPVVDGVAILEPYITRYTVDYGDDSVVEIEESNVTFTSIRSSDGTLITDPPYSSHLSGEVRANNSLFREIVYTTTRLQHLLDSAGISYNFTRLIDVIDHRAQDLDLGPEKIPA